MFELFRIFLYGVGFFSIPFLIALLIRFFNPAADMIPVIFGSLGMTFLILLVGSFIKELVE